MIREASNRRHPVSWGISRVMPVALHTSTDFGNCPGTRAENAMALQLAGIDSEVPKDICKKKKSRHFLCRPDRSAFGRQTTELQKPSISAGRAIRGHYGHANPIQIALNAGAQVVGCQGVASDVAIYAALPVLEGIPDGSRVAFHPWTFLESARLLCTALYSDCMAEN